MLINRTGGGGENVKNEVTAQTAIIQNIAELIGIVPIPNAKHLWAKFESEGGTFIGLVVSTQEDTYPDGIGEDGYYYQKIAYIMSADGNGTYLLEL